MDVKAWLAGRGLMIERSKSGSTDAVDSRPITHVFLDGGKASVPTKERSDFMDACAAQIAHNAHPFHGVERTVCGRAYRMFADLDVPPGANLGELLPHALSQLPEAMRVGTVVVCRRRHAPPGAKKGVHLVWSDDALLVDDARAMELRDAWVARCDPDKADWQAVIDAAVYRRNGLRMPFALKRSTDDTSAVYAPVFEATFDGDGRVCLQRVVMPKAGDAKDAVQAFVREWLDRASIHPETDVVIEGAVAAGAGAPRHKRRKPDDVAVDQAGDAPYGPPQLVAASAEAALRSVLPREYAHCSLTGSRSSDTSLVVFTDSKYCMHAGRKHKGNHVYFVAARGGALTQRCFSSKCGGARHEICKAPSAMFSGLAANDGGNKDGGKRSKASEGAKGSKRSKAPEGGGKRSKAPEGGGKRSKAPEGGGKRSKAAEGAKGAKRSKGAEGGEGGKKKRPQLTGVTSAADAAARWIAVLPH